MPYSGAGRDRDRDDAEPLTEVLMLALLARRDAQINVCGHDDARTSKLRPWIRGATVQFGSKFKIM
jgi:hypothetical protein